MIDANQSRFHLVLGKDDWGAFLSPGSQSGADPASWTKLSEIWKIPEASHSISWSDRSQTIILSLRTPEFKASAHDAAPVPNQRRAAAMDKFGNVYRIADDGHSIIVTNSGDNTNTVFWPPKPDPVDIPAGSFHPVEPEEVKRPDLAGLAVLPGHWLVAGSRDTTGSILLFDLVGGANPLRMPLSAKAPIVPWDLSTTATGGLCILDRQNRKIWTLDRTLGADLSAIEPEETFFHNDTGAPTPRPRDASIRRQLDTPIVIDADWDPISVEALPDGSILVLERPQTGWGRLERIRSDGGRETASLQIIASTMTFPDESSRSDFQISGYDLALIETGTDAVSVAVVADDGNQAFRLDIKLSKTEWEIEPVATELLLRRYSGVELVCSPTGVLYFCDSRWVPLVELRRRRYAEFGQLASPILDGETPGFAWHRLMLDGRIPSGATVTIKVRTADRREELPLAPWQTQPDLVFRQSGSEIPWTDQVSDSVGGAGTWEVLLQNAKGRFLQLLLEFSGQELHTPSIYAMRIWKPRFSYLDHYLPAVYREDAGSRDFLERFLANFEGLFTSIEDRIVHSTALFDARIAPNPTLDWLAGWLGLVFDPALDEKRRRLLLRHAPILFSYRGTPQGILLALHIATSECLEDEDFALPLPSERHLFGIRLSEQFLLRNRSAALAGETLVDLSNVEQITGRWNVQAGATDLQARWLAWLQAAQNDPVRSSEAKAVLAEQPEFRPIPPSTTRIWDEFCQYALGAKPTLSANVQAVWLQEYLAAYPEANQKNVPDLPVDLPRSAKDSEIWIATLADLPPNVRRNLSRWQNSLRRRWGRIERMNTAWGTTWPSFDLVAPFDRIPRDAEPLRDWATFETFLEPVAALAHRFLVLIPTTGPLDDRSDFARVVDHTRRVVELEKPAHTSFDIQPYWALFRVGQARLGLDSELSEGSRSESLMPWLRVGSAQIGAARIWWEQLPADRFLIENRTYRTRGG